MSVAQPIPSSAVPTPSKAASRDYQSWLKILTALAVVGGLIGTYLALFYAGTDLVQGNVQRVFYFHLSAFMGATLAFVVACGAGVAYLRTRHPKWDILSHAGVEVGLALSLITLITGMIWARPIWNTWWTWDPRLTSAAIMALTYAAYLVLRNAIESPDKQRTFAAIYAILAITTVFATFAITRLRPDTIHPVVIGPSPANAEGGFEVTAHIGMTIGINIMIWVALITPALLWWRVRLQNMIQYTYQLRSQLEQ